ncbi:MAG: TfoX/Sxy family DNA transformation protein [Pseudomonadales bacterium]|nr:TfoX/Sxy family DNA transformation protein [Kiritimatiellia bacterium]MDP6972216.1 TfoX/Sxy family DNA transformation protein [Pseudomonadales bacterium]
MRLDFEAVGTLKNIGPTIAKNLQLIGIRTRADLEKATPAGAYLHLCASFQNTTSPVCYYLYSLEGALRDKHWDDLSPKLKDKLQAEVKARQRGIERSA